MRGLAFALALSLSAIPHAHAQTAYFANGNQINPWHVTGWSCTPSGDFCTIDFVGSAKFTAVNDYVCMANSSDQTSSAVAIQNVSKSEILVTAMWPETVTGVCMGF